jgi:dTDP-4-dehydrorhamnose reductase
MRIFIAGGNGQLGVDCSKVLSMAYDVCSLDLPSMDITRREQVFRCLDGIKPDVVVNCAAFTSVDACESDATCWAVNGDGPGNLAGWCRSAGSFLVHISTDYVFSGGKPLFEPYRETDLPAPISEYGKSKRAGEVAVLESGANAAILRTAWLYGSHGKNFLKTMLRLALADPNRVIRVVNDQFGSPTWSLTLAHQIMAVIECKAAGLFHAVSGGYCSWFELASRFLSAMGVPHQFKPCTSADYTTEAVRPSNSIMENQRLKELGIDQFQSWEQELDGFIEKYRSDLIAEAKEMGWAKKGTCR